MIAYNKSEAQRLSALTGKKVEWREQNPVDVLSLLNMYISIGVPQILPGLKPAHEAIAELIYAAMRAEAALSDIGDADREEGDDVAWCERRALEAIPMLRAALTRVGAVP